MTHTDHSDVYGALHEDGINRVINHLQHKRPSLFNYGTARVVAGTHATAGTPAHENIDVRRPCLRVRGSRLPRRQRT